MAVLHGRESVFAFVYLYKDEELIDTNYEYVIEKDKLRRQQGR